MDDEDGMESFDLSDRDIELLADTRTTACFCPTTERDLADALEVSRQSVSKWETDASIPELDKLLRLAELFGVTLDELVKGDLWNAYSHLRHGRR